MSPRKRRAAEVPFQMAPMIDMVFLLLVFFMTVSTMAKDARPELDLATSVTAGVPEETPIRDIITVKMEGMEIHYFWGSRPVGQNELASLLEDSADGDILLRGGPDLPWRVWDGLLQMCRENGIGQLVFATFED